MIVHSLPVLHSHRYLACSGFRGRHLAPESACGIFPCLPLSACCTCIQRTKSDRSEEESMAGGRKTSSLLCCRCRRCVFSGIVRVLACIVSCVLVTAGLVALILYLVFRPHVIQASVDAADLGTFTLETRTWILRYNLSLAVHLRNPNRRIAIHYHHVNAQALYQDQRFAYDDHLPEFFQDAGDTSLLSPSFHGQIPLVGGFAAAGFRREAAENATFSIDVKLDARMKLKLWILRAPGPNPKIDCPLRIRRRKRDTGELRPGSFYPTQCRVRF